jgi:hypothetical protein
MFTKFARLNTTGRSTLSQMCCLWGAAAASSDTAAAVRQAKSYSGSHPFVIHVYNEAGSVIETHKHSENHFAP